MFCFFNSDYQRTVSWTGCLRAASGHTSSPPESILRVFSISDSDPTAMGLSNPSPAGERTSSFSALWTRSGEDLGTLSLRGLIRTEERRYWKLGRSERSYLLKRASILGHGFSTNTSGTCQCCKFKENIKQKENTNTSSTQIRSTDSLILAQIQHCHFLFFGRKFSK